jgi:hypothetical protein
MIRDLFLGIGALGLVILILFVLLIPFICVIVLGIGFANMLGFTGIVWWSFLIIFYLILVGILGALV